MDLSLSLVPGFGLSRAEGSFGSAVVDASESESVLDVDLRVFDDVERQILDAHRLLLTERKVEEILEGGFLVGVGEDGSDGDARFDDDDLGFDGIDEKAFRPDLEMVRDLVPDHLLRDGRLIVDPRISDASNEFRDQVRDLKASGSESREGFGGDDSRGGKEDVFDEVSGRSGKIAGGERGRADRRGQLETKGGREEKKTRTGSECTPPLQRTTVQVS